MTNFMKKLIEAGYSKNDMFHHCADLYIYVTPITSQVIDEWCKENNYIKSWHFPVFTDAVTGKKMYDCAFQYAE